MFKQFAKVVNDQLNKMQKTGTLYTVDVDKDAMWELYLASFPEGTNQMYRERTEHDCSCCRQFIKQIGNVVAIKGNKIVSIWDGNAKDEYAVVSKALSDFVKSHEIDGELVTTQSKYGIEENYEEIDGEVKTYSHFYGELDNEHIYKGRETVDTVAGQKRATYQVFGRGLKELTVDAMETVIELVEHNTIHRGTEHLQALRDLLKLKKDYDKSRNKNLFILREAPKAPMSVTRMRNTAIGTLLVDLSEGVDIEKAVRSYDVKVNGANYMRKKPIITEAARKRAAKEVEEMGLTKALYRRFARIEDIHIEDVLYADYDSSTQMQPASDNPFESLKAAPNVSSKDFSKVEEVSIDKFLKDIAPNATSVSLLFENDLKHNLMSLIGPKDEEAPSMFKWNNPYSWTYSGNYADSVIRENVKKVGGTVDAPFRMSIMWNTPDARNESDLDLHCEAPRKHIYFANRGSSFDGIQLDVDIRNPVSDDRTGPENIAVENIFSKDLSSLDKGQYRFYIHNFSAWHNETGFQAELVVNGTTYTYQMQVPLRDGAKIDICTATWDGKEFSLKHHMTPTEVKSSKWGLDTQEFHKVKFIMNSPNHWEREENKTGHKHYLFVLEGAKNDERPSGFFNEYLDQRLRQHARTFEALTNVMRVEEDDKQLSGVGFSSTKRASAVFKVEGKTNRVFKVNF